MTVDVEVPPLKTVVMILSVMVRVAIGPTSLHKEDAAVGIELITDVARSEEASVVSIAGIGRTAPLTVVMGTGIATKPSLTVTVSTGGPSPPPIGVGASIMTGTSMDGIPEGAGTNVMLLTMSGIFCLCLRICRRRPCNAI